MQESEMTAEEIEVEIISLEKTVNNCGHKYGGKLLMKIARIKRQLIEKQNHR